MTALLQSLRRQAARLTVQAGATTRLQALDALRGLIIVVMALDHANEFIAHGKYGLEMWTFLWPAYQGDALAFSTRLVTHLAAPGFFFLLGTGMILFSQSRQKKGWSHWRISGHFILRGAVLIAFQFLLENPAWGVGVDTGPQGPYFGVLYALGATMIVGSALYLLPGRILVLLGTTIVTITEFLLPAASGFPDYPLPRLLLTTPGFNGDTLVLYSLLPWLGVVALGMAYGTWLHRDRQQAYRAAVWLGAGALIAFAVLRWWGAFGNIRPPLGTDWIAFFNVVKYPPALTFLLLTLGINLIILRAFAALEQTRPLALWPLVIFGRAPLFFYVTHLFLYAYMGLLINPTGIGIARMYPFWLLGLVILFPLCWLYGKLKQNSRPASVWHLL